MVRNRIPRRASRYQSDSDNLSKAIFGGFDGIMSVLSIVAVGFVIGDTKHMLIYAGGLAVSEMLSMGGGSLLSELVGVYRVRHALIIGLAALIGVLIPPLPFLFLPSYQAAIVSLCLTCAVAASIAQIRVKQLGVLSAYMQTFVIVFVVAVGTITVALLLNGVGA